MIITIDGPTASGKSTVARLLAHKLSYYYLNSGLLFRALAYVLVAHVQKDQKKLELVDPTTIALALSKIDYCYDASTGGYITVENRDITDKLKGAESDHWASVIATQKSVREAIEKVQRSIGRKHDLVADGRDCGTTVFPQAEYKFFLTASLEIRAERWRKDQEKKGNCLSLEESMAFIEERDRRDTQREISPLKPAIDARIIDNSCLTVTQTVDLLFSLVS